MGYTLHMANRQLNLADPECEPTDEELIGLAHRAFAGLREAAAHRAASLRNELAEARTEALARFAARLAR